MWYFGVGYILEFGILESCLLEFGKVWWSMVVGRKSIAGGSVATALLPLLSAARAMPHYLTTSCSCYSCTCAAHKYMWTFTNAQDS